MQSAFSPDRIFTKSESISMKRAPLAVISFADNKTIPGTITDKPGIQCKRIDNSAHFVDMNPQAEPGKKFTPLAIPLEVMKKKNFASTLPNRELVTEPAEYNPGSTILDTQHVHTESSESYRNLNKKRVTKHHTSASMKAQPKSKVRESLDKKEPEMRVTGIKRKVPASREALRSSQPLEKKHLENIKVSKTKSPRNMLNRNVLTEHTPDHATPKAAEKKKKPKLVKKEKPETSQGRKAKEVKEAKEARLTKTVVGVGIRQRTATEQTTEKSPPRESTELDKFVKYNAMKILWELKEQKKQEEFERRLNEERKAALDEGNKRIREANYMRFNYQTKTNPKHKVAWGADQRKFTRPARSSSIKKELKPKIDDEERRRILGLDHMDENKLERFREKVRMTLNQDSFEEAEEHPKAKKQMTEDEYEDLHRYMIEKKIRMEEENKHKKLEEYEDYERRRRNLERLFVEIRESRAHIPKPKKKGKKRTKKRRIERFEDGSKVQQIATEPNDLRLGTQESDDENYSLLYDEYKKIIKSKTTPKGEPGQRKGSGQGKQVLAPIQQNLYEQDEFEQKKKEYKKKYDEISNRYQKNLVNNIQMQENKLNSRQLEHNLEEDQEEQDEDYSDQQEMQDSLPANSAREIIEAAAIFIQKNYRGYRTRKILREYISQLFREYQEECEARGEYYEEEEEEEDEDAIRNQMQEGEYYEEGEEEGDEEKEIEDEDINEEEIHYMQQPGLYQQGRHDQEVEEADEERYENEGEEEEEEREEGEREGEEEEEQVEIEDEDNYEFLGDDEKQSLRSLLEKQKLGLHEEYNDAYDQNQEEEEEEELDEQANEQAGPGGNFVERYRQIKDQYQALYDQEDLRGGAEEDEGVRNESDLDVDQDIIDINEDAEEEREVEKEGSEYFVAPPPRMAKSDGEIIENYQFDLDEESQVIINDELDYMEGDLEEGDLEEGDLEEGASEDGDNQISLHGEGDDDYQAVMKDKNMRFNFERGGMLAETKQKETVEKQNEDEKVEDSHDEYVEENQEDQEGEYEGEDQEGYDPQYDQRFQKGYLQGYQGNLQEGEGDLEEYDQEEEEGYIHQSDYDVDYDQEGQQYQHEREQSKSERDQKKPVDHRKVYSEGGLMYRGREEQQEEEELEEQEDYTQERYEQEGSEFNEENQNQTPENVYQLQQDHEDEEEQDHEDEEHEGYLDQQHLHRNGEGEKMVMISTINSEEDVDAGLQSADAQKSRSSQRRHKSDLTAPKAEGGSQSQSHSHKGSEERKSQTLSTLSQKEKTGKSRGQEELQGAIKSQDRYSQEYEEVEDYEENIEEEMPNSAEKGEYGTDSEHYREELIEELKQNQQKEKGDRYRYSEEQEDELQEEEGGEDEEDFFRRAGSVKEPGPQQEEKTSVNERLSEKSKHGVQKSGDFSEQYQAELNRLREEQATKWDQMVESLSLLTSQGEVQFNQNIKAFIETLQKQSEINKLALASEIEHVELPEDQIPLEGQGDTGNFQMNYLNERVGFQGPQGTRTLDVSKISPTLKKKLDVISPRQESKYSKKQKPLGFPKKNALHVDVNMANEESHEAESGGLNLDLSQMRLVLGSEQLLREQSARTLSQSASAQSDGESVDYQGLEGEGTSIFERDPFKEFTRRKFKELMEQENMKNLIKMREQALEIRHKTHLDHMKKMLENRRVSPRTFQNKQMELEKWITQEREIIQKTKKDIERGWLSTADSIQRTQRDLQFLQKIFTGVEGRNANMSGDISLRHSFTDEEAGENTETQSERLSRRSFLNAAGELRSPSPSKNIKIIDKFELKDQLFSPQLNNSIGSKKDHVEELKAEFERQDSEEKSQNVGDLMGSPLHAKEEDVSKKHLQLEQISSQPSTGRKAVEYQLDSVRALSQGEHPEEEDNLQALTSEEMRSTDEEAVQNRPAKVQTSYEKKDLYRKDSPLENDVEVHPDELIDEEIEWEHEVSQSPRIFEERIENRDYTPGRSHFSARRDLASPMQLGDNTGSITSGYSPKSQEDLRHMFQERMNVFKQMQTYQNEVEEGETEREEREIEGEGEEQNLEAIDTENIQIKTDIICGEILEDLFEELGVELFSPGKERILEKIPLLGEEPPVQPNLHNLIENNYFFHAGVEHPNFQANIPMPHTASPEHFRHPHDRIGSPGRELELTPEQQRQQHLVYMQTEMLKTLGIRTEIAYVTQYLEALMEEITGPYKDNFLRNINTPLGFTPFEKLTNMRSYGLGASEASSLAASSSESQLVLETHVYFTLEEIMMERNPERNEVSTELEHIHNKMIFDCCNEMLNIFRPFGVKGQPYPWKAGSKATNSQHVTEDNMIQVLEKVQTKVLDWASYLCGYFGENDEFLHDKNQSFIDEYLAQVREERILRMLSEEIFEMENKWITYDEEEAEVELEMADLVFDHMVTETAELIAQLHENKRNQAMKGRIVQNIPNLRRINQQIEHTDDMNFNSV